MTHPPEDLDRELRQLRGRQLRAILSSDWQAIAGARRNLPLLRESLCRPRSVARTCLLDSPLLGGWIQDVLFWRELWRRSVNFLDRGGAPTERNWLFDRIARTEYLTEAVPSGKIDAGFPRRVRDRAVRVLRNRWSDLPRILLPHLPASGIGRVRLHFSERLDEGCPANRIRLGMTPAVLLWRGAGRPRHVTARLSHGALTLKGPLAIRLYETIPGTSILLAHRLVSTRRSLRVGHRVSGLGRRTKQALSLVDRAWPWAGEEVRRRSWMVVPLVEPGTVSYSQLARPGISYINVLRGTILDLADDLLHETAHHRLHARQELGPLIRDDGDPRYTSPWRQGLRPLNGILHGAYTFLFRAELFLRLLRGEPALSPARRGWIRTEAEREIAHCAQALRELAVADSEGLLTRSGVILGREMVRRLEGLRRGRLYGWNHSSIF